MLLIEGTEEERENKRKNYELICRVFTVTMVTSGLIFGSFISYKELYKEIEGYEDLTWKYFDFTIAICDSVSATVMINSLQNF